MNTVQFHKRLIEENTAKTLSHNVTLGNIRQSSRKVHIHLL